MMEFRKGHLVARLAGSDADVARAQSLRHLAFHAVRGHSLPGALDRDPFDLACQHVLVEHAVTGQLLACFRVLLLGEGQGLDQSYSAQFYDLAPLQAYRGPKMELGRFCLHPDHPDPDLLRLAWAVVTRVVDAQGVTLMFGCTSFVGADPALHGAALGYLHRHHLAPPQWQPQVSALAQVPLARFSQLGADPKLALVALPPLLRSYLAIGAWVSDHAVIDPAMGTLHVFTGVEVAAIPPARARALRALAG